MQRGKICREHGTKKSFNIIFVPFVPCYFSLERLGFRTSRSYLKKFGCEQHTKTHLGKSRVIHSFKKSPRALFFSSILEQNRGEPTLPRVSRVPTVGTKIYLYRRIPCESRCSAVPTPLANTYPVEHLLSQGFPRFQKNCLKNRQKCSRHFTEHLLSQAFPMALKK